MSDAASISIGFHAIETLLRNDPSRIVTLWIDRRRTDQRLDTLLELAERSGVRVRRAPRAKLDRLSANARHQGVVGELRSETHERLNEAQLLEHLSTLTNPLLLILDGVLDPHNLGACLRSAAAAGVCALVVPQNRSAAMTPIVRKVASGGAEIVPLVSVANLARFLRQLKTQSIWLIGTSDSADQCLYETDLSGPCALIMGGEGEGLRALTAQQCDRFVHIPLADTPVSSLNVSVATGIVLFEAVRQRRQHALERGAQAFVL